MGYWRGPGPSARSGASPISRRSSPSCSWKPSRRPSRAWRPRHEPSTQHLAGRPAGDPRTRPQPWVHPLGPVHDRHRGGLVRHPAAADRGRRADEGRAGPAGAERARRRDRRRRDAVRPGDRHLGLRRCRRGQRRPGRRGGRRRRRGAARPLDRRRDPLRQGSRPGSRPGRLGGRRRPARRRRIDRQRCRPGRPRGRPAAAGGRGPRAADRGRPVAVPRRQHRGRAHPRRHLQLRLHGPDRRRRGEAEPGGGGGPLHGPSARPAHGQGGGDRRPGDRPAGRLRRGRPRRGIVDEPLRAAQHDPGGAPAPHGLVHPRVHAVLDRPRLPRRPRVADGRGLERQHPGDDDRDDQLLRGDLRRHQRSGRTRRHDRDVLPPGGAVRGPAAGRLRCHPRLAGDRRRSGSRWPRSGSCSRSAPGSTPARSCRSAAG